MALLPVALMSSCAEDVFKDVKVDEPESIIQRQYLKEYDMLKNINPSLNIGVAVDAAEYGKQGALYGLASTNFTEVTTKSGLLHGSGVTDNGGLSLGAFYDMLDAAKKANQSIFGHALVSNLDQNTKYIKNILADKPDPNGGAIPTRLVKANIIDNGDCEGDDVSCLFSKENQGNPHASELVAGKGKDGSKCVVLKATAKAAESWDNQFFIRFNRSLPAGTKFSFSMDIKADKATGGISSQEHGSTPGGYLHWAFVGSPSFTTDWATYTNEGTTTSADVQTIAFNLNDFAEANTYYFDNMKFIIEYEEELPPFYWEDVVINGDCEGDDVSSLYSKENQGNPHASELVAGKGKDGSKCVVLKATAKAAESWDNQFFIKFSEPLPAGTEYKFSMDIKAEKQTGGISSQEHGATPGGYLHWAFVGSPSFTTDWATYTAEGKTTSADVQTIAFNLSDFAEANTYYFDNMKFEVYKERAGGGIKLTPEEKRDTLKFAINKWITGVMAANEGYVKSWDITSDVFDDKGAIYTGFNTEAGAEFKDGKFTWQDLIAPDGSDEFFRYAVATARDAYAANGGDGALKLFVNESGLTNAAKRDNVIKAIKSWESDGKTKIDGIGAFIKVSYNTDATTQQENEKAITEMLNALKETGRLVRISGIDMGYNDGALELGNAALTTENLKAMGKFYEFIVKSYREIIPDAQKGGICQWNATDTNGNPNGLWSDKYSRKPQYGGFADGLK